MCGRRKACKYGSGAYADEPWSLQAYQKRVYALRDTYGTKMAANGTPVQELQKLMGHRDIKMTLRYVEVSSEQLRDAVTATFD